MGKKKKQIVVNSTTWSEDDEQKLFSYRFVDGMSFSWIASELNRSSEACRKKYNSTVWESKSYYTEVEQDKRTKYEESIKKSINKKQETEILKIDIIGDKIADAIKAYPLVPKKIYVPSLAKNKVRSEEDAALILSDIHIGHEYSLEETGGIAEYNENIIAIRTERLKRSVADITDLHSKLYKIPTLHIFCLGDIVAGMNGAGNWSNTFINLSIYDQFSKGAAILADMIHSWTGLFDKIRFYGVRGNHGRAAPEGIEKDYVNWDVICYDYLKQAFKNNPSVEFVIPKTWWILEKIKSHNFLLVHGDDIRGKSFPVKSVADFELKMAGIVKCLPDYTIAGHFHNAAEFTTNHGRTIINGSFIGGDVYSMKDIHSSSKPEQKIFGIHEKYGITWTYNINLGIERDWEGNTSPK